MQRLHSDTDQVFRCFEAFAGHHNDVDRVLHVAKRTTDDDATVTGVALVDSIICDETRNGPDREQIVK